MADESQRHVKKVTDDAKHRTGTIRAAIKPHKVSNESTTKVDVGKVITTCLSSVKAGTLSQTYTGSTLTKNATLIRSGFGISSTDDLYLLADPTGSGKAGLLLASSAAYVADGRGSVSKIPWKDFKSCKIANQNGMLVVGQAGIMTRDAKTLTSLLQSIQSKLS